MARLRNGSYGETVAHLERNLDLNGLEVSDDLPMATMTSSSPKPKSLLCNRLSSDIVCNYCKEKNHMFKDCKKLKKRKTKDANMANQSKRRHIPNMGLVAKVTTLRNNVGKAQVRTSSLNVLDLRIRRWQSGLRSPKITAQLHIVQHLILIQKGRPKKLASPRLQHNHLVSVRQYVSLILQLKSSTNISSNWWGIPVLSGSNRWSKQFSSHIIQPICTKTYSCLGPWLHHKLHIPIQTHSFIRWLQSDIHRSRLWQRSLVGHRNL